MEGRHQVVQEEAGQEDGHRALRKGLGFRVDAGCTGQEDWHRALRKELRIDDALAKKTGIMY